MASMAASARSLKRRPEEYRQTEAAMAARSRRVAAGVGAGVRRTPERRAPAMGSPGRVRRFGRRRRRGQGDGEEEVIEGYENRCADIERLGSGRKKFSNDWKIFFQWLEKSGRIFQ